MILTLSMPRIASSSNLFTPSYAPEERSTSRQLSARCERLLAMTSVFRRTFLLACVGTATAMATARPVGFIGLGIMGEGMTNNLLKAGIPVHIWSRDRKKSESFAFAAEGNGLPSVSIEDTPADVIASCERTYLMLSTPAACEEVYTMAGGVLEGVSEGKQIIDCATLRPGDMSSLAKRVRAKGGAFVEAPVSGSKGPAAAGALVFMAAGDKAVFDLALQVELAAMGKKSVFCGEEVGTATRMKLVVNTIMGAQLAALAEGIALAENLDLNVEDMQSVLEEGAMASPMLKLKGPLVRLLLACNPTGKPRAPAFPILLSQTRPGLTRADH